MTKAGQMEAVIRSVGEGETMTFSLANANAASWRAKVAYLNQKDGYRHYSVALNSALGIIGIVNNGDKFKKIENNA